MPRKKSTSSKKRPRKDAEPTPHEEEPPASAQQDADDDDDDDDDEAHLQALAAAWADHDPDDDGYVDDDNAKTVNVATVSSQQKQADESFANDDANRKCQSEKLKREPKKKQGPTTITYVTNNRYENKSYSLHFSQLPFDATEWEIRAWLAEKAPCCTLADLRLVYDAGLDAGRGVFRGVAFGECTTAAGYAAALALHQQARLRGRRINIRPTRTKQELTHIVQQRDAIVQEKVRTLLGKRKGGDKTETNNESKTESSKGDKKKKKHKNIKEGDAGTDHNKKQAVKDQQQEPPRKLTKKERNRRAAIIMSKKREQGVKK